MNTSGMLTDYSVWARWPRYSPDMSKPTRMTFAGAGIQLAADAWGDATAPPVLFLHGGGQTRHAWDSTARAVAAAGWHAVTLDLRGHGESDRSPDGDYSPDPMVADLRSVVAALSRPPVAVGASLGGLISLLAEGTEPLLAGLALVDVTPRLERTGMQRIVAFMTARPDGFASLDEAADAVAAYLPHRPRPTDLSGLARNLRQTPAGRYVWHWDPALLSRSQAEFEHDVVRYTAAARRLTLPTLLVRGQRSDVLSEEGAQWFCTLAPHTRYVDVSGAGHMVAGDRNDAFTDAILEFLTEALAASTG